MTAKQQPAPHSRYPPENRSKPGGDGRTPRRRWAPPAGDDAGGRVERATRRTQSASRGPCGSLGRTRASRATAPAGAGSAPGCERLFGAGGLQIMSLSNRQAYRMRASHLESRGA
eukprot:scaffold1822_cov445-Prasinococcus_capsulatus_cf.AAC.1